MFQGSGGFGGGFGSNAGGGGGGAGGGFGGGFNSDQSFTSPGGSNSPIPNLSSEFNSYSCRIPLNISYCSN